MSQQEESANYFRLVHLLIDIGSDVLRDVLLKTIHPDTLTIFMQKNINKINYLNQKKLLFQNQYKLLIKSPAVHHGELDITLLCWIFSNLCNTSPTNGWQTPPGPTDQGLGDDIYRLKKFRNTIYGHKPTTRVTAADFQTLWTELEELIIRLAKLGTPTIQQNISVRVTAIRSQDLDPESTKKELTEVMYSWKTDEETWERIKEKLRKQEEQLGNHGEKLEKQDNQLEKQGEKLGKQENQLRTHDKQLDKHEEQLGNQEEQLGKLGKQLGKQEEQLEKQDKQQDKQEEELKDHREQLQQQDEKLRAMDQKVTDILEEHDNQNTTFTTEDEHLSESQRAPLIQQNVEGTYVQIGDNNVMRQKHGLSSEDDEQETGFPSLPTRKTVQQLDKERKVRPKKQLMDMKVHSNLAYAGGATQNTKQPKKSYSQVLQTFNAEKAVVVNYIVQNTEQTTLPLSREDSQLNVFLNAVKGFKRGHFVLVTCGAQPDETIQNIGKVPWTVVFDFDPKSRAHGLLSQAEIPLMRKRSLHIKTWKDKSVITEQSTNWIFVQGIKDQPDTQTDEKFQKWKKQTKSGIENIMGQMEKFGKSYTNYYVVVMWPSNEKLSSHVKHLLDELENLGLCDFVIVTEKRGDASDVSETLFKQMQDDYEKKPTILRLSIRNVCLAINRVFLRSTSNKNTKFDLPTLEPSYIGISDQQAQWLKEDLEVLYETSPYDFDYSLDKLKEETDNFYRGGNWPWYMWYETGAGQVDVERAIMKDIIGSLKHHIEAFKLGRVTICHAPGSGGTTLAQRILWELHKDTPCVQVKLRTGSSDVASRIQLVYEKTRLPILILLDGEDEQRVDLLARELRDIVFVILYVKRYPYPMEGKKNSKNCFWLKRFVTRQESVNIAHKFLHQCESEGTKAAVKKLQLEVENERSGHEIFEFGLATYKHHYKGVESYVNGFLQLENNSENELLPWQHALGILSLVYFYGQAAMPCKFFSKLLKYPLFLIDDFPLEMDALIMKDTNDGRANMVRISHYLVAKEILEQILSRPITRGDRVAELCLTAKRKLEPFAVDFIRLAAKSRLETSAGIIEKIMTRTFISRDNKAAGERDLVDRPRKFAQILHDVSSQAPYTERFRILEELVKSFPNEPQFLAHLGRLYSLCRPEDENSAERCFVKALEICDKEIEGFAIDDITYSMRLTLMHIYHMYGNMFLTRVSKYTGKSSEDKPMRHVSDDKVKKTLDELFPMVQKACGYFSKCRDVTPTGSEESHGFLGEIRLRLMFCEFVFRRNGFDDIYELIKKFEDSEMAAFVEDTISKVDELVLECLSVVDPDKIEQELQYYQTWFAILFKTHTPWNVVFRTHETVKLRRLQITARKLLYEKEKVYGVLEEVKDTSDIQFIVKNYEANFKDIHDNGIESPRKAIDLDYREWIFAIRHKYLRITYTLEDVLKQVRLWHEKVQTPNSRFYLFILCSLLGFQGNTELLVEAQQHKDDLLKQSKYITKPKYPREMLGAGPGICCLTPGTRFFRLIEGREIKGNFNSDSVKIMIGTICGPNDKPAAGYIRLDLGRDHLIPVSVFFVPVRSDMKGPAYADMRVEFYVGFSIAHGYEAYNVRQLKKMRCKRCGIYLEVRSKSHTKCNCGEVIKSE